MFALQFAVIIKAFLRDLLDWRSNVSKIRNTMIGLLSFINRELLVIIGILAVTAMSAVLVLRGRSVLYVCNIARDGRRFLARFAVLGLQVLRHEVFLALGQSGRGLNHEGFCSALNRKGSNQRKQLAR